MRERLRRIVADTIGVGPEQVARDASVDTVTDWDSLRHLELMLELELAFDVTISSDMMAVLTSLDAIEEFLRDEGVAEPV